LEATNTSNKINANFNYSPSSRGRRCPHSSPRSPKKTPTFFEKWCLWITLQERTASWWITLQERTAAWWITLQERTASWWITLQERTAITWQKWWATTIGGGNDVMKNFRWALKAFKRSDCTVVQLSTMSYAAALLHDDHVHKSVCQRGSFVQCVVRSVCFVINSSLDHA
jgi:hypothetical protein